MVHCRGGQLQRGGEGRGGGGGGGERKVEWKEGAIPTTLQYTHPFGSRDHLKLAQPTLVLTQVALLLGTHVWTHPHYGATLMQDLPLNLSHLLVPLLQSIIQILGCCSLRVGGEGEGGQEQDGLQGEAFGFE